MAENNLKPNCNRIILSKQGLSSTEVKKVLNLILTSSDKTISIVIRRHKKPGEVC